MSKKKKISVVQSNYIPWKGYFDLINMADQFILYDDVQYTKNDWRNRNQIKTPGGKQWITIPVRRETLNQKIYETVVVNDRWRKKHWKTINQYYSKATYFKDYKHVFEKLYLGSDERHLSMINRRFIETICELLEIKTNISWSMNYNLVGGKTERLVDLCKQTGASEYISGPSARGYIDQEKFNKEGIDLHYMEYSGYTEYKQLYPPFDHHVSIIDLIFCMGKDAKKYMKSFQ